MARFFIDRPVFAIVLAIIITLLGTIAGFSLPIAQYPNITKPRISVNTNYVGASADIVEKAVAQTIEQKVSGGNITSSSMLNSRKYAEQTW